MIRIVNGTEVTLTPEEEAAWLAEQVPYDPWISIRAERNRLLIGSDWSQLPDAPCDQEAWAAYRQALRDLPSTYPDPTILVWPLNPTDTGKAS